MTKRHNAKYKVDRKLGVNLWGRPKSPFNKRETRPGQHGARSKKPTDYGLQLIAKQKIRFYYGNIGEKQFHKIYQEAIRLKGNSAENLIKLLEKRLDITVYRMKFVPTIFAAKQFINHGHVLVNGKRVNIGSYRLSEGDVIEVRQKSQNIPMVQEAQVLAEREVPEYLSVDGFKGTYIRVPSFDEVPFPVKMDPQLVIGFYSR